MEIQITPSFEASCRLAAARIAALVRAQPDCTLGLATGATAAAVYPHLLAAWRAGEVSFRRTRTVNLDEYLGLPAGDARSYRAQMDAWLLRQADFAPENTYVADGAADPERELEVFRARLAGGVDLQLLGVGANGHIGFNEPGERLTAGVHLETLSAATRAANARFFARPEDVPRRAVTMGVGDILRAERLLLVITGESKREAARMLLCGDEVSTRWPVTLLKLHRRVTVVLDRALADSL